MYCLTEYCRMNNCVNYIRWYLNHILKYTRELLKESNYSLINNFTFINFDLLCTVKRLGPDYYSSIRFISWNSVFVFCGHVSTMLLILCNTCQVARFSINFVTQKLTRHKVYSWLLLFLLEQSKLQKLLFSVLSNIAMLS